MRYFTDKLWSDINSESQEIREKANLQWQKNDEEYYKIFQKVKEKLPKRFLEIYGQQYGFHDYELKKFQIIHGDKGYKDPVAVNIIISNSEQTWSISYEKIKKIEINYELHPDIFERKRRREYMGFDDYGYNEFFEIDERTLSHEILFASGATILVYFEKISINKITS